MIRSWWCSCAAPYDWHHNSWEPWSGVHLLQHELQTSHSSLHVRRSRQKKKQDRWTLPHFTVLVRVHRKELEINRCRLDFSRVFQHSNIIPDSLITPAKNASVFFDQRWKSSSQPMNASSYAHDLPHRWDSECPSELELWQDCWLLALHRQVQILLPLELWVWIPLVAHEWQLATSSSTSLLLKSRYCNLSSCVSPHAMSTNNQSPANKVHQWARHHTNNESNNDPCAPPAHCVTSYVTSPITTLPWWKNMTVCQMPGIVFLNRSRNARQCLYLVKTEGQTTVFVCTSCTVWHCRKQVRILTRIKIGKKEKLPSTEHCARAKHTTWTDPHKRQKTKLTTMLCGSILQKRAPSSNIRPACHGQKRVGISPYQKMVTC